MTGDWRDKVLEILDRHIAEMEGQASKKYKRRSWLAFGQSKSLANYLRRLRKEVIRLTDG